jgi:isopenicillin N synthase-like dioxygenase
MAPEADVADAIPIIDIGAYLAGRPGAHAAAACAVHDALTNVGFFVLTGHDVPLPLIERTFGEARRFHQLPMDRKLALKLNEHNNGYMVMGRYAVRTSDINNNDRSVYSGDLNEAFFMKRERPANRCCCRVGALSALTNGRPKPTSRVSAPICWNMRRSWTASRGVSWMS